MDFLSPQMRAAFEAYKRDYPEEYARERRKAREVALRCVGVLGSVDDALDHAFGCAKCSRALGIVTIEIKAP